MSMHELDLLDECLLESGTADALTVKKIVQILREWGLCLNCILRYLSVKNQELYNSISDDKLNFWLMNNNGNDLTTKINSNENLTTICTTCLGILQTKFCNASFISQIVQMVYKQNFEFSDFYCALSLPVSLLIREHSVYIALHELYPDTYDLTYDRNSIIPIKEVWKKINGPLLSQQLGKPFNSKSIFEIQVFYEYKNDERECAFLRDLSPKTFQKRKASCGVFNRNNISNILKDTKHELFKKFCKTPMRPPIVDCYCETVICSNQSLYIAGRYNKFSRTLSQTPWYIDGLKKFENSVEEILCQPIAKLFMAKDYKFSSSGREDVDVRMLGKGRPFLVELINPKNVLIDDVKLREVENIINQASKDVFVRDVQLVTKEDTHHLKEGEEKKVKMYKALCIVKGRIHDNQLEIINNMKNIELKQKTPIRVLHRRPLATRSRLIHEIKIEKIDVQDNIQETDSKIENNHNNDHNKINNNNNNDDGNDDDNNKDNNNDKNSNNNCNDDDNYRTLFVLNVSTQAGTYVKEFVHGDFSRTLPNLCTLLGMECDILSLDVHDIELDWPTQINYY